MQSPSDTKSSLIEADFSAQHETGETPAFKSESNKKQLHCEFLDQPLMMSADALKRIMADQRSPNSFTLQQPSKPVSDHSSAVAKFSPRDFESGGD